MQRGLSQGTITDEDIDTVEPRVYEWATETNQWITSNIGEVASARFLDNSKSLSFHTTIEGEHAPEKVRLRNRALVALRAWLENLTTLIESSAYDA